MNSICFVYEYGTELWSSPWSLMTEFRKRGWKVDRLHLTNGEALKLKDNLYDVIIVMDWKGVDIPKDVHDILSGSCFKIRENGDTPQNYDKHLTVSVGYDLLITPDYQSSLKYKEAGYNSLWVNHFADTEIHRIHHTIDGIPSKVRSTRGKGGSGLMDMLSLIMPNKFLNTNGLVGAEYGLFLSCGEIVLQNSRWKEITRRIFEGMACGKLVITDRLSSETKIGDLFQEDVDIVYYDGLSDCISKINYYLWDHEARTKIAINGYKKVMENHTQVQRVDLLIEKYNEWKANIQ